MSFDELVFFAVFIVVEPTNSNEEEAIYNYINKDIGFKRDSFETARDRYNKLSHNLSQMDILEIKRATRDFDIQRGKIQEMYAANQITHSENIQRTLYISERFEEILNGILSEPHYDEKKLRNFSFSELFKQSTKEINKSTLHRF